MFKTFLRKYGVLCIVLFNLSLAFAIGFYIGHVTAPPIECKCDPPAQIEQDEQPMREEQPAPPVKLVRNMTVTATAYCPCVKCCGKTDGITATGTKAIAGRTIAVDPSVIPYGTEVIINGNTYIAEDCGGAINGNDIDIFFDSHEAALQFGRQTLIAQIVLV